MTCEECPLRERCYERRGICLDCIRYMERIEEARRKIEQLNEDYKKAALYGAASDMRKELIGSNFAIECIRKELEYGLQLPEAEQEHTGG